MTLIGKVYRAMSAGICATALTVAAMSITTVSTVEAKSSSNHVNPTQLASTLVNQFWANVQAHNVEAFSNMIANIFQGGNTLGIVNRAQEIVILSNLNLTNFVISNLIATQQKDVLVVSYTFTATENGNNIVDNRISVFKRIGKHEKKCDTNPAKWRLVSQSNFSAFQ